MEPIIERRAAEESRYDYRVNPDTGSIIDALVKVSTEGCSHPVYRDAARDLFLLGVVVMTKTVEDQGMGEETYPVLLDPTLLVLDDGVLRLYLADRVDAASLGLDLEFQPDEFVLVTMGTTKLPTPQLIKGTLLMEHEGWVDAWKKAEKKLAEFLGR